MTKFKSYLFFFFMLFATATAFAAEPFDINLWPKKAPNSNGIKNDTARVRVFLPDARHATGRAVLVCLGLTSIWQCSMRATTGHRSSTTWE